MNPGGEEGEETNFSSSSSPSFRIGSPTTISAATVLDLIHHSPSSSEDDFEFAALGEAASGADEMFDNGRIRPVYPVFDRSLLNGGDGERKRGSLRKLFLLERGGSDEEEGSSSSSEADDLEGVPEGTYCVWTPKAKEAAEKCKKSGSTRSTSSSSLRGKLRDLVIGRSNSDGKEKFLFVANNSKGKRAGSGRNRKTFLPYKQDLVGIFSSVNSISRNHHPF